MSEMNPPAVAAGVRSKLARRDDVDTEHPSPRLGVPLLRTAHVCAAPSMSWASSTGEAAENDGLLNAL
jgi:hypothetical protein